MKLYESIGKNGETYYIIANSKKESIHILRKELKYEILNNKRDGDAKQLFDSFVTYKVKLDKPKIIAYLPLTDNNK